jgi:hypothetical protein
MATIAEGVTGYFGGIFPLKCGCRSQEQLPCPKMASTIAALHATLEVSD